MIIRRSHALLGGIAVVAASVGLVVVNASSGDGERFRINTDEFAECLDAGMDQLTTGSSLPGACDDNG